MPFNSHAVSATHAIVKGIGKYVYDNAEPLARMAVDETGIGVYEDKVLKNKGKARVIWNNLKDKKSRGIIGEDAVMNAQSLPQVKMPNRDGFIPRQFGTRGDRLVFSNGILILGGLAALLIVLFGGATHALIPLYAVGVFVSFTLSQASMVRRWLSRREPGWWWRWMLNAVGAATTGLVMLVIAATKFSHGAWMVVLLIPLLVALFMMIRRHYADVARQLSLDNYGGPPPIDHSVLVLVGDLHRGVAAALRYAQTLSASAKAVYVELDPDRTQKLEEKWGKFGLGVPLVVLTSPYRSLLTPFLDYVNHLLAVGQNHVVTIVIPEFVPARWWQHLLHNQTALLIKGALLFRKGVVVVDVPFHLR